jgi:hypothetical protein
MPELAKTITPYQIEILGLFDEGKTRVAIRGPHGLGKTTTASVLVHHAVLTSESDAKIPTTASAWRQLEKYLWPEIWKVRQFIDWPATGRPPYDTRTELFAQSIRLRGEDVEAFALASDDHTTLEGAHSTRMVVVFDEAKTIPPATWDAVEGAFSTEGLSSDHEVIVFAISTPGDPVGRFYDIHIHKPGYEDWYTRHVTIDEAISAGRVSPLWVTNRKRQWGEDSAVYLNRVLGEFADSSEAGIIPLSWVRMANERWRMWDLGGRKNDSSSRVLGVDVARGGEDATVLALRLALVIAEIREFRKIPTTETVRHVKAFEKGTQVHIEMDGGLGAGVYDVLRDDDWPNLVPITVGARTTRRDKTGELTFANVRAAMWWNLREMLDPINGVGLALPPHDGLTLDLVTPMIGETRSGQIVLESKESIARRIGRSTDYGDAVCLACWPSTLGGGYVF